MEQLIASLLEKTLVGGAFIYLLHSFVNKQAVTLDKIADTLGKVSETLASLEQRVEKLEEKK